MITFQETKPKKVYIINRDDSRISILELKTSTITNKFDIITKFIEDLSKFHGKEFDDWFEDFIVSYSNKESSRFQIVSSNVEKIKTFVNSYVDSLNIDFSAYVDESKTKTKKTIVFEAEDIEVIIKLSGYLKIYTLISNSEKICLENSLHKIVYNMFISDISVDIVTKIFEVIKTKTYRYKLTDRFMWDYVKTVQCKPIQYHVSNIFNFIVSNILVLCETDKNPITWFVTVTDESIRWILRSVYKETVVYTDSITLDDIQTSMSSDSLKTICYNETLGRLKRAALDRIFENLGDKEEEVVLNNRLQSFKFISPACHFLVFPILSKITGVPYEHMCTLSPEHSAEISVYCYYLLTSIFGEEYSNLFNLLLYAPTENPPTTSTFKIRNVFNWSDINNEIGNFFGFRCSAVPCKLLSFFLGKFSRLGLVNIINGKEMVSIPMQKIEADAIKFFPMFFSDSFDDKFSQIRKLMYKDL